MCANMTIEPALTETAQVTYRFIEAPWLGEYAADAGTDFRIDPPWEMWLFPGTTEKSVCAFVHADQTPERDERFIVWLSDPTGVVLENNRAWITILNNDLPIVSVDDVTVSESGNTAEFTVRLHEPGIEPASIRYTTEPMISVDAPASPGEDYTATSGTLEIPAGTTTATISVPIIGDAVDEPHETFRLVLSNPELLAMGDSVAIGTITDDDDGWTIDDPSVWEDAGSIEFTVARDHTSANAVTVAYTISSAGSAAGGTSCADDGVDYLTPPGSVTLQPSDTTATVTVTLCDDDETEGRETLILELEGVTGRDLIGIATIVDDDGGAIN